MVRVRLALALVIGGVLVGCSAVIALDKYRSCQSTECTGEADASSDVQEESLTIGPACATDVECANGYTLCSEGHCASATKLGRGMSQFECVLLSDRTARCWGLNVDGQLGNGKPSAQAVPAPVVDVNGVVLHNIADISLGYKYACARVVQKTVTSVFCWGTVGSVNGPYAQQVDLPGSVSALSAGRDGACALIEDGSVRCWGTNTYGQLGCTNDAPSCVDGGPVPLQKTMPAPLTQVATFIGVGLNVTCVSISNDSGNFKCWGSNGAGNLGNGTIASTCCDVGGASITTGGAIARIEPADFLTCARDNLASHRWQCWGDDQSASILGAGGPQAQPFTLPASVNGANLSPGWRHVCAATADGMQVLCWGQNDHGQVGDPMVQSTLVPMEHPVVLPSSAFPVTDVASHRHWTCAIGADNRVYCWGQNFVQSVVGTWLLGAASAQPDDVTTPAPVQWSP